MSSSRTGAARSAAILLVSCHISNYHTNPILGKTYNENMKEYLKQQLEHQKQLLFLDIPSLKNRKNFLSKLKSNATSGNGGGAATQQNDDNISDDNEIDQQYHFYANHTYNSRDTREGSSSYDGLDDEVDWDNSSVELFELGALPSPASEQAHVAVNIIINILLKKNVPFY